MNKKSCEACKNGIEEPFPFTMAFQPIINLEKKTVFAYEALVRGPEGESAYQILSKVNDENRYSFDQSCRIKAISLSTELGILDTGAMLSINFLPNAIYNPAACIQATLTAARENSFPLERLIFEITEGEKIEDSEHLCNIVEEYSKQGFKTAIDDFGAGYAGLNLLSEFQPDLIKIDMALVRDVHKKHVSKAIIESIIKVAADLNIEVIAEGIETKEEMEALKLMGINLHQGYLYAKPGFEALPQPDYPD